jgi:DNA-binding transcriptional MerR regulator
MSITQKIWKIGDIAKLTGLTVRTLHHYDHIELLIPSQYSEAGHRLYIETDIAKLQQIISLKQLGFALEDIKVIIHNAGYKPEGCNY